MEYIIQSETLENIADAIRAKTGKTDAITPEEMPAEIQEITGGDPTAMLDALMDDTLVDAYGDATKLPTNIFRMKKSLKTINYPNAEIAETGALQGCSFLESVNLPKLKSISSDGMGSTNILTLDFPQLETVAIRAFAYTKLTALIIRSSTPCTATGDPFLSSAIAKGTGYIYVPSALVATYKAATNWSLYADQIRAIEDYPEITGG